MKPFSGYLKKLPADRRARIEDGARQKVAAIRLQLAREAAGVTQEELAERLHMSQPALSRFERRPNITTSVLIRYIEALGGTLEVTMVLPNGAKTATGKRPAARGRSAGRRIALVST